MYLVEVNKDINKYCVLFPSQIKPMLHFSFSLCFDSTQWILQMKTLQLIDQSDSPPRAGYTDLQGG